MPTKILYYDACIINVLKKTTKNYCVMTLLHVTLIIKKHIVLVNTGYLFEQNTVIILLYTDSAYASIHYSHTHCRL